jgi:hypothetical protein
MRSILKPLEGWAIFGRKVSIEVLEFAVAVMTAQGGYLEAT